MSKCVLLLLFIAFHLPLQGYQVVVNDCGDESAFNPTTSPEVAYPGSGLVTLRSAIEYLNQQGQSSNSISFRPGVSPFVIELLDTALPDIVVPLTIRGMSATKSNRLARKIILQGPGASNPKLLSGLTFAKGSDGSKVEGLVINGFIGDGLTLFGAAITILSDSCQIRNNFLGLDATGRLVAPNLSGIVVEGNRCVIEKNVIAGNLLGLSCFYSGANFEGNQLLPYPIGAIFISGCKNQVISNLIGTDITGKNTLLNDIGVRICGNDNHVASNVLYGTIAGVQIVGLPNTCFGKALPRNIQAGRNNRIINNAIGTTRDGNTIFSSFGIGVHLAYGPLDGITPQNNQIFQNRISGFSKGIQLGAVNTPVLNNDIYENVITNNTLYGIFATNASYNSIRANVLSANGEFGIYLTDQVAGNQIVNNMIGTDVTGMLPLGNGKDGIRIQTPYFCTWWNLPVQQNNSTVISGNIISNNGQSGIHLAGNTTNNIIQDNWIGLAYDASPLGNGGNGITIEASSYNLIGGSPLAGTEPQGNLIAYNGGFGLLIDPSSTQNMSLGNTIWDNALP